MGEGRTAGGSERGSRPGGMKGPGYRREVDFPGGIDCEVLRRYQCGRVPADPGNGAMARSGDGREVGTGVPRRMDRAKFVSKLLGFTAELGISFSPEQAAECYAHAALMVEWNRQSNLTRITDFEEILSRHVLDSIVPGRELPAEGIALDIGTGAGYPGIPLKVLHPGLDMWLVESNRKKISFLKAAVASIPLTGVRTLHGRWEEICAAGDLSRGGGADLVTMRAVRLEAMHLERLAPAVLRPGGTFAWWGGPGAESAENMPLEGTGMKFDRAIGYGLPGVLRTRHVYTWIRAA